LTAKNGSKVVSAFHEGYPAGTYNNDQAETNTGKWAFSSQSALSVKQL
jgi:hypothetical protein